MNKLFSNFDKVTLVRVWSFFLLYSVFISLLIQFVVLPIMLPQYHMGNGLLDGGDWTFYHSKSIELSNIINTNGWSSWEMRPRGFGILGFISAIYSFTGINEPYVLIPFFSTLHAIGAISIVAIIEKLGVSRSVAIISAIPFLIFPSSLLWVTQILKDVFTINGSLLILLGLVGLVNIPRKVFSAYIIKKQLISSIFIIFGFLIIWLVRPYYLQISLIFMLLMFFVMNSFLVLKMLKRKASGLFVLSTFLIQFMLFYAVDSFQIPAYKKTDKNSLITAIPSPTMLQASSEGRQLNNQASSEGRQLNNQASSEGRQLNNQASSEGRQLNNQVILKGKAYKDWVASPYLPTRIDNEFKKLYLQRSYFYQVQSNANSTIDYGYDLNSTEKIILYIPRAVQIAFLSPFPSSWLADHPTKLSKLTHLVTGIEMIFIYLSFIGVFISAYLWRRKIEFWMVITFSFYFALIPTYAFPNIGALIRYRYGAIMLLAALGISIFLYKYAKKEKD